MRSVEKLRVFVGASKESRPIVNRIASELSKRKFSVIPWYHDDFAKGNRYFLDQLIDAPDEHEFDFAIFVMRADDLTKTRGKLFSTPRDNVLFELGIFMSKLGKDGKGQHRTFLLAPKPWQIKKAKLKLPSDFQGYTPHYYEQPEPAANKADRLANLKEVLKPVLRKIKIQMEASGPHGPECVEQPAGALTLLTEYFKSSMKQRVVKNLALDLGATWNIYETLLERPDVRNITVQTLMLDGKSPEIVAASRDSGSPTAEAALRHEDRLVDYLKEESHDLAKRGIHFECRAYARVPFVHGFLMKQYKLLLTMLRLEKGKMVGQPNPYWDHDYPKTNTKSTSKKQRILLTFEAYELWFDQQWKNARHIWPAAK